MLLNKEIEQQHLIAQQKLSLLTNYYDWAFELINFQSGNRIWDSSAGIGNLSMKLIDKCEFLLITEYSNENLKILQEKFKDLKHVVIERCDLLNIDVQKYTTFNIDTIINLDVIEYIEDDQKVLNDFYRVLISGGRLLIKTPAHPFMYSEIDRKSLHFRRYSKKELRLKLEKAGFVVEKIRTINFFGALVYFLKGKMMKKKTNFSNTFSDKKLIKINKLIPFLIYFDKIVNIPIGLSYIVLAKKE